MFNNIGHKIQVLAKVLCWIGIICWVITGACPHGWRLIHDVSAERRVCAG